MIATSVAPEKSEITMNMVYRPPFTVKLTYFKHSGKFYTEGEYVSQKLNLYDIWDELKDMLRHGIRPGLIDGPCEFHVVVNVPDHPHDHPLLIHPSSVIRDV